MIRSFAIYSLIAFTLIAIVLSYIISGHIRDDKRENLYEITQFTMNIVIKKQLAMENYNEKLSDDKAAEIQADIKNAMQSYRIRTMTLIGSDKAVIMEDNQPANGKWIVDHDSVDKILQADRPFIVSKTYELSDSEGVPGKISVFDLYVPVQYDDEIVGVLVLQIPSGTIDEHVEMINMLVILTLTGGLFLLFLLLIGILFRSSKTLVKQNKDLSQQKAELEISYGKLNDAYIGTVRALSTAIDARDAYTAGHSSRVTRISLLIGKAVNLSEQDMKTLEYASLLHDIGKIGIPDQILNKKGKLTDEEYGYIKKHPEIGITILSKVDFLSKSLPIIKHHHERYVGAGYPDGLAGEAIPIGARILAIADTYDAMTTDRPYRKAFDHESAIREIIANKGIQFDENLVDAFLSIENEI